MEAYVKLQPTETAPKISKPPAAPQAETPEELGFERQPKVDWLAPMQLARIGLQVYMSTVFGSFFDKRELQAVLGPPDCERDYSVDHEEIWFDYVADLGDGFNSTYTVARLLGAPELNPGAGLPLPRGRFLLMGGDQVYPTASREEYRNRLEGPYRAALPWVEDDLKAPHLYAIPGNHDWYDGLTSFTRLFCQYGARTGKYRWIGGWRTRQTRSYFALKLPAGWWLWGIDAQLSSYIDKPQIAYFESIAKQMREQAEKPRLILVTAQPSWVSCGVGDPGSAGMIDPKQFDSLEFFESRIIRRSGIRPALVIAGDLHHYCRYEQAGGGPEATHRITSGGGGAYLFGTHQMPRKLDVPEGSGSGERKRVPKVTYERKGAYPPVEISRALTWRTWLLPVHNWSFSLLLGAVFMLFGWTMDRADRFNPLSLVFALLVVAGLWGFARAQGKPYQPRLPWLGLVHGVAQVALGVGLFHGLSSLNRGIPEPWNSLLLSIEMVAGGFLGALLFAAYLLASSRFCCGHTNEIFSSQGIEDYKSFLRLHIAKDGTLTLYPMGVEKVPRRWVLDPKAPVGSPWFQPAQGEPPVVAHLIEGPVVLR